MAMNDEEIRQLDFMGMGHSLKQALQRTVTHAIVYKWDEEVHIDSLHINYDAALFFLRLWARSEWESEWELEERLPDEAFETMTLSQLKDLFAATYDERGAWVDIAVLDAETKVLEDPE
jgi:hypothetical protein